MKLSEIERRLKELYADGPADQLRETILGAARTELSRSWADRLTSGRKLWATVAASFALVLALLYGEGIRHRSAIRLLLPRVKEAKSVELPEVALVPGLEDLLARRTENVDPIVELSWYQQQIQDLLETNYNSESGLFRPNG